MTGVGSNGASHTATQPTEQSSQLSGGNNVTSGELPTDKPVLHLPLLHHSKLSHLHYRTVHRSDIPQLQWLHNTLFPLKYHDDFYESLVTAHIPSYTILATLPSGAAYSEDAIVAVITVKFVQYNIDEPDVQYHTRDLHFVNNVDDIYTSEHIAAYICTLGVLLTYQRSGLATLLLSAIEPLIRQYSHNNVNTVLLHVHQDNQTALSIYLNHRYTVKMLLLKHYHYNDIDHNAYALYKCLSTQPVSGETPAQPESDRAVLVDVHKALQNVATAEHVESSWFGSLFSYCKVM